VVGIEGTLSGAALKGDYLSVAGVGDDFFATKIGAVASIAARIGFARDNWLVYGKAGYAGARVKVSVIDNLAPNVGSGDASDWNSGWTVGAGIEYGLTTNIVLGIEYNYLRLGAHNSNLASLPASYGWDVKTHIDTVLGRISYKFGLVPLAAKY
jgi:outer membrane immunogenic protein